jgi:MFS family permease
VDQTSPSYKDPTALFAIPEFRSFITGRVLFVMGIRMTVTVIGWWIYLLTDSKLALGFVGLSEVIPAVSLSLYAGHRIDQSEKRRLLLRCIILYSLCVAALFFLAAPETARSLNNWTIAYLICGVIACTGLIRAFAGPTFGAIVPSIVGKELLAQAATTSSATWLTGSILGHALGGFFIALLGIQYTFLAILGFIFWGYLLLIRIKKKPPAGNVVGTSWQSIREGINYVYRTKELLGALSLDLFAVLFGGAAALIPVFARDILHVGPVGFGWLNAATDIGSIITVLYLTLNPLRGHQGKILFFAIAGFGVFIIIFALSEIFWISFIALLLSGCLDGISVVVRGTILQLKTPDSLRGRVLAVNSMFISSSNELGQFESGVMAKLMGTVPSVIFGGCMTLAVVIVTWFKAPSLRKMEY